MIVVSRSTGRSGSVMSSQLPVVSEPQRCRAGPVPDRSLVRHPVIPADAGISSGERHRRLFRGEIPAFAGMTVSFRRNDGERSRSALLRQEVRDREVALAGVVVEGEDALAWADLRELLGDGGEA